MVLTFTPPFLLATGPAVSAPTISTSTITPPPWVISLHLAWHLSTTSRQILLSTTSHLITPEYGWRPGAPVQTICWSDLRSADVPPFLGEIFDHKQSVRDISGEQARVGLLVHLQRLR